MEIYISESSSFIEILREVASRLRNEIDMYPQEWIIRNYLRGDEYDNQTNEQYCSDYF